MQYIRGCKQSATGAFAGSLSRSALGTSHWQPQERVAVAGCQAEAMKGLRARQKTCKRRGSLGASCKIACGSSRRFNNAPRESGLPLAAAMVQCREQARRADSGHDRRSGSLPQAVLRPSSSQRSSSLGTILAAAPRAIPASESQHPQTGNHGVPGEQICQARPTLGSGGSAYRPLAAGPHA
jgi:hypothetical protein